MEKCFATRYNLLKLNSRRETLKGGCELLKKRRESMVKEFMGLAGECAEKREEITGILSAGWRKLEITKALTPEAVHSFAHAAKRNISFDIKVKNLLGVNIPEVAELPVLKAIEARGVSPLGERAGIMDMAKEFESAIGNVIRLINREVKLERLSEVIKSDTRKINSIEELILPGIKNEIGSIERTLDEREREEVFRLKRHKQRKSVNMGRI